jgi:hypothetical protein
MQQTGIETIQHVATSLGGLGRYGDTYIVHAAEGETVVPLEVLDHDPLLKERLFDSMRAMGIEPERYIVGNELNSKNPITGQPEFFFKQIKKIFKSPIAQVAAGAFMPGPFGWLAAPAMEAIAGGDMKDILHAGVRGGAGRLGGDYLGGKGLFTDQGTPDWWSTVKEKMWNPGKTLSFDDTWALGEKYKKMGVDQYGYTGEKLKAFVKMKVDEDIARLSQSGILNKMGAKLLDDPLKTGLVSLSAWAQYDQAKRANEALKRQQEGEGEDYDYDVSDDIIENIIGTTTPITAPSPVIPVAQGGAISKVFPHKDGGISGPGTGTSDDIPAMLSDGEFVMTANAVKGAGGGSRSAGTKKMYDMMRKFEGQA